jgi:hypothetical protein
VSDSLNLIRADQLRVGDVIIHNEYPADLIAVGPLACGSVFLMWGYGPADHCAVAPHATVNVVGRMSDPVVAWPDA